MSQDNYIEHCISCASSSSSPSVFLAHVNAEQRLRCDRAEMLHQLAHLGDDLLCESLTNGGYRWANVSPADIRLNRSLRGQCPQCLEGKMKNKSMPSSQTPPADRVGAMITFDLHSLLVKSKGGNFNSLRSVDEFSGDQQVWATANKTAESVFKTIMYLV